MTPCNSKLDPCHNAVCKNWLHGKGKATLNHDTVAAADGMENDDIEYYVQIL